MPCHSEMDPAYTKYGAGTSAAGPSGVKVSVSMPFSATNILSHGVPVTRCSSSPMDSDTVITPPARRAATVSAARISWVTTPGTSMFRVAEVHTSGLYQMYGRRRRALDSHTASPVVGGGSLTTMSASMTSSRANAWTSKLRYWATPRT